MNGMKYFIFPRSAGLAHSSSSARPDGPWSLGGGGSKKERVWAGLQAKLKSFDENVGETKKVLTGAPTAFGIHRLFWPAFSSGSELAPRRTSPTDEIPIVVSEITIDN